MKKVKGKKRLLGEDDLEKLGKNHNYTRRKWILDAFAIIFIVTITIISVIFIYKLIVDEVVQNTVVNLVAENILGIVFFALAMFGISKKE